MKKILLFLIIFLVAVALCACGEQPQPVNQENEVVETPTIEQEINSGEELSFDDYIEAYISRSNYNVTLKIGENKTREIDMNYAKEYYKLLKPYEDNYETLCMTVDIAGKDFPALVIKSGDSIKAYEYENGTAKEIDAKQFNLKEEDYTYIFNGINLFENAIMSQGNLCIYLEGVKIGDRTKEEILNDYVTLYDDLYLGSDYHSEEYEDGTVLEQNTIMSLDDNGKLIMTIEDTGLNIEKKLAVNGIDEKVVRGACYSPNYKDIAYIYELTEKGNVYMIDCSEVNIINAEQNSVDAKKIVSSENVISLESNYQYPYHILKD